MNTRAEQDSSTRAFTHTTGHPPCIDPTDMKGRQPPSHCCENRAPHPAAPSTRDLHTETHGAGPAQTSRRSSHFRTMKFTVRSCLLQLCVPQAGDLHVLGGLGSQVSVRWLDGLKHTGDLASGSVNLGNAEHSRACRKHDSKGIRSSVRDQSPPGAPCASHCHEHHIVLYESKLQLQELPDRLLLHAQWLFLRCCYAYQLLKARIYRT